MFKNWSIGVKLATGFGAVAIILLIVGGAALIDISALATNIAEIGDDTTMADGAMEAKYAVGQQQLLAMEAFNAANAAEVAELAAENEAAAQSFNEDISEVLAVAQSDTSDSVHLEVIKLAEAAIAQHNEFDPLVLQAFELGSQLTASPDDTALAAKVTEVDKELDDLGKQIIADMNSLEELTDSMIVESNVAAAATAARARIQSVIMLVTGLVLAIGLAIVITRSITKPLERVIAGLSAGSEQVTSAANQVAQASQQMAQGASEQASSLEETSSSLEEMSSMTRQNAENSKQADAMAREARASAGKGVEAMDKMSEAIGRIKESADSTAKIIKTIDEIAFQTNLLALNAAVEAARAGEAGKGFAVVAEEVRNLAQRSAEAAKTTSSLIEGSQVNSDGGVKVTEEVGDLLKQIADQADKVTSLVSEVAAASDEQAQGIDQINTAVAQMDRVTQSSASNSEESASASEELSAQARELQDMVVQLRMVVGGAKAAQRADEYGHAVSSARPIAVDHRLSHLIRPGANVRSESGGNGHSHQQFAMAGAAVRPQEVIPLDDDELRDF
ncbi:MAG: chemotaxis protein [Actinobacteria bacterium HGW-Actinobacteria-10]|nr:MAG: chemotaxis protein [Actinobacteria bacterium HGW-Actinobacteria-10]